MEQMSQIRKLVRDSLESAGVEMALLSVEMRGLDDVQLLLRLEALWPSLTSVKSFSNFIEDDLGLGGGRRKMTILVEDNPTLARVIKLFLDRSKHDVVVTVAKTYKEALELVNYFSRKRMVSLLIVDVNLAHSMIDRSSSGRTGIGILKAHAKIVAHTSQDVPSVAITNRMTDEESAMTCKSLASYCIDVSDIDQIGRIIDACLSQS